MSAEQEVIAADDVTTEAGRQTFRLPVTQTWVGTGAGWRCLAGHAGPSSEPAPRDRADA